MRKKILINCLTLEGANLIPLLLKIKEWNEHGCKIWIFGTIFLHKKIKKLDIVVDYEFIEFKSQILSKSGKLTFMFSCLQRNFSAMFYIKDLIGKFDVIYTISSTLDLLIVPYVLKIKDDNIQWVTVFDNTVPLSDPGNKIIRFLAWSFFHISLIFLRRTDKIFAISQDLQTFLIQKSFSATKIVVTGNAIEREMIKQAKKDDKYQIDALFIGRINDTKGIYDMLKVLNIVKQKYPNFQLAFMGQGDAVTEKHFKEKIRTMRLGNNVQFLGYKVGIDKFTIIKSSKSFLFLSVSESESFGISLLEAVCSGLPSFAYDLKPYKHIYQNNEVFIFKKHDYTSVAQKIIEVFDNQEFENKAGKLLLNKYSWTEIAHIELNSM